MVIRGRIRGNGRQLAAYLLTQAENEDIRILDVAGRDDASADLLHRTLLSMSLTSELTRSDKGLYHAQINPAYGEDRRMAPESWLQAAGILETELGMTDQRRVIVLHTKKGRTHAHVVWERYNDQKGKMISDSFSRLAQDRARHEMERIFEQKRTPKRNEKRPEMKTILSDLWSRHKSAAAFIKEAGKAGYTIAAGVQRRPFMVVDDTGRSFDLVRQLDGVKTKAVRERLKGQKLIAEKEAIAQVRAKQKQEEKIASNDNDKAREKIEVKEVENEQEQAALTDQTTQAEKNQTIALGFAETRNEITTDEHKEFEKRSREIAQDFAASRDDVLQQEAEDDFDKRKREAAQNFAANRDEALSHETEKERQRREILERLKRLKEQQKDRGREPE